MSATVKFLIGLAAVLLMGWIYHGPLGNGEALIDSLEGQAKVAVERSEVPGIGVRLSRQPLARVATLSGPANQFQREGQGSLKGLNDVVGEIEGVSSVDWADTPEARSRVMPLLAETLGFLALAYLAGVVLGRLLFGRRKHEGYL
ncbi:MAG: hypothetical protein JWL74_1510 [Alphaproteobacteria bacterium]|jgi:hypothetical protein|nr:hypothetical protein [Alphaproteobacteria bacterium]